MKKTFFQIGWRFWVVISITLVLFIPSATIAIWGMFHPLLIGKFSILLVVAFPLIISLFCLIQTSTYTIVLTDEELYTLGQIGWGKMQYPVNIKYSEISKLGLSYTNKNSLGKKIYPASYKIGMPCLYLKIYTKDEKRSTNILLEFFSVTQRKQIVDMISKNSNLDVTYEWLLSNKK